MKRPLFAAAAIALLCGYTPAPSSTALAMMDSTVEIHVVIEATIIDKDGKPSDEKTSDGWTGSGVVYANNGKASLILSANHVLETPAVGSTEEITRSFLGFEVNAGSRRIDSVKITATNASGLECNVRVLRLGVSDTRDVATGRVDCDIGRPAQIASSTPSRGQKVYVSGHSLGVPVPMVTEGYVSGWMMGYLLISAPAAPGNSGGPVFYNGQVFGLLVRGSTRYANISLLVPLEQLLLRIGDTPGL